MTWCSPRVPATSARSASSRPPRPTSCTSRWTSDGSDPVGAAAKRSPPWPRPASEPSSSTPCRRHQNPAGVTLPEPVGSEILAICRAGRPADLRGRPVRSARLRRGADAGAAVPRAATGCSTSSTFSKTFAPGLRVGWILAPHAVREKLVMASEAQILCPSAFAQAAISTYFATMPWRNSSRSFREIYRERRDAAAGRADRPDAGRHPLDAARTVASTSG